MQLHYPSFSALSIFKTAHNSLLLKPINSISSHCVHDYTFCTCFLFQIESLNHYYSNFNKYAVNNRAESDAPRLSSPAAILSLEKAFSVNSSRNSLIKDSSSRRLETRLNKSFSCDVHNNESVIPDHIANISRTSSSELSAELDKLLS